MALRRKSCVRAAETCLLYKLVVSIESCICKRDPSKGILPIYYLLLKLRV